MVECRVDPQTTHCADPAIDVLSGGQPGAQPLPEGAETEIARLHGANYGFLRCPHGVVGD